MSAVPAETWGADRPASATLASRIFEKLREDILEGHFKPGEKLRISSLQERYAAGGSPVREALNRLTSVSLVEQVDQRGFRVAPLGEAELLELNRTRCLLNELVIREAVAYGDGSWEDNIAVAYQRMWKCPMFMADGDVNREWELLHRRFHAALIAACPSRWLRDFHEQLFDSADRHRRQSARRFDRERANASHRAIMEAVVSRDVQRAVELLNADINTHLVSASQ